MIGEEQKFTLDTLVAAAENGDLALLECDEVATGKKVITICAVNTEPGGTYELVPLARLFDGDPYEQLQPPMEKTLQDCNLPIPHPALEAKNTIN